MRGVALALVAVLGCSTEEHEPGGDPLVHPSLDGDGFDDGEVAIRIDPDVVPNVLAAGPDGSLFVAAHVDVHLTPDGAINGRNLVIKLRSDGRLDTTFGDGGIWIQREVGDSIHDVIARPDGGPWLLVSDGASPVVWRLASNGVPDGTFGAGGALPIDTSSLGGEPAWGMDLSSGTDGSVWILGSKANAMSLRERQFVARIAVDGTVTLGPLLPEQETWWGILIAADGTAKLAGERWDGAAFHPIVASVTSDLDVDLAMAKVATTVSYCRTPIVLTDGALAATGTSSGGTTSEGAVLRFLADGTADAEFDGDGHLPIGTNEWAGALAPLPAGGVLAQLWPFNPPGPPERTVRISSTGGVTGESVGTEVSGFGVVVATDGQAYAGAWGWPDTIRIRRLPEP